MNQEVDNQDLKAATEHILAVKQEHEDDLLSKPNVVGVAIGYRQIDGESTQTLALVVMVDRKIPLNLLTPEQQIPVTIEDVPIDVQEVGEISAH